MATPSSKAVNPAQFSPSSPLMSMSSSVQHPPQPAPVPAQFASSTSIMYQAPKRLLIFRETKNPDNQGESVFTAVNTQGLPICGAAPYFGAQSSFGAVTELPLRVLKAFTEIFNTPKYKNWAIVGASPYHDPGEEGKFYAVILEQMRDQTLNQAGIGGR